MILKVLSPLQIVLIPEQSKVPRPDSALSLVGVAGEEVSHWFFCLMLLLLLLAGGCALEVRVDARLGFEEAAVFHFAVEGGGCYLIKLLLP